VSTSADEWSGNVGASVGKQARALSTEATKELLRDAALRVLERDGVLSGVSLKRVATEAGLSQSLINYHFGSRQALLREALAEKRRAYWARFTRSTRRAPFVQRLHWSFAGITDDPQWARIMALLALERDETFEPFQNFDETMADHRADIAAGMVVEDFDPEATHAVYIALAVGWGLLREAASRQVGVPVKRLDARAESVILKMFSLFVPNPAPTKHRRSQHDRT
jgi:AcrR family transcriptional regulator